MVASWMSEVLLKFAEPVKYSALYCHFKELGVSVTMTPFKRYNPRIRTLL